MKFLRPFLWAAVLVAAFLYVTSHGQWKLARMLPQVGSAGHLWEAPAEAAGTYSTDEQNNIDIYKAAHEATVNITSRVYRQDWFFQIYPEEGTGSGFIINPDGKILTNNHVVRGASQLTVKLSNMRSYKARVLGTDPRNDLALIQIDAGKLPTLHFGDSDNIVVGQKVLAIGNPFGLEGTLTTGIVSSLNRGLETEENRRLEGLIQTDAAINPGNSGGPLLDSHGNVIGINTAILGSQGNIGIGFAMPVNRAKAMLDEFQARGHISRPVLGIRTVWVSGDLAQMLELPARGGLLVQGVDRGSPAAEAGLRGPRQVVVVGNYQLGVGGDLIVAVDGQAVEGNDSLQRVMNRKRGGDNLGLTIYRNGRQEQVRIRLGEAPQEL
jgi:putative serine protease PepD